AFQGTQAYYSYWANALTATMKITVIEQTGAPEITSYLAGTKEAINVFFSDRSSGYGANFRCTNAMFKTAELSRDSEYVKTQLDVLCLPSSTDATSGATSAINAQVGNGTTTAI
ncbi:MAG: hypothetical protein KGL39_45810, partial [Patescibacteria group bacterium]|nr:hypothetical protein [Patescibacteria group bacterium]